MEADKQTQIHENVDSNHTADIENMTPKDLREGLKKFGIKTRVRDVRIEEDITRDHCRRYHCRCHIIGHL